MRDEVLNKLWKDLGGRKMERKIRLKSLNNIITCRICRGYLIDATTITECLHTFCKSCLVKHFENNKTCPSCKVIVHESHPLQYISHDRTMQDIVYKLVPNLQKNEEREEREFYRSRGLPCPRDFPLNVDEANAEDDKVQEPATETEIGKHEELITVCLECLHPKLKTTKRLFIRCTAQATIAHVKKFVAKKLCDGMEHCKDIDVLCNEEPLGKDFTLKYVYVTRWKFQNPVFTLQCRAKFDSR